MKKSIILQSFICLLAVSCSVEELGDIAPTALDEHEVFYASFESSETGTRVHLDENIKILWDAEDQISIFNKSTLNQQYEFMGEDDDNSGTFQWVSSDYFGAGNDLDYICAVYPYQESTSISNSNILTLNLPSEQTYREKSFGLGANTMVATTDSHLLMFKNVGGYLALKFYGGDSDHKVSVKSIRLVGNNGEPLSGEGTVQLPYDEAPEIEMASTAGKTILLNCEEEPVELGTTSDNPTIFWMVVPPADFTDGFTLLVTDTNDDVFIKETHVHLAIDRNTILRIAPIQVDFNSDNLNISKVESADQDKLPSKTAYDGRTITVTTPTLNRSHFVLDYEFTGESLKANGLDVVPGETPLDVTKPVTLTVRNGSHGKNYTLVGCNTGLPVVRINTKGLFTRQELEAYLNALQNNGVDQRVWLPTADKTFVTVRIENPDGTPGMKTKDGDPIYETDTQIKGRGNYSWKWEKKPYALKFDKKTTVLGMPAHKRWVLLANWRDRTLLRNDATFWLAKKATDELPYTTRGQFVELEFNGEYRGNYYLCEQIKIDENRVAITEIGDNAEDPTGGFLMEIDSYFDEVNKFLSEPFGLRYMFKEPDEDADALEAAGEIELANNFRAAYSWMQNRINGLETVLKTKSAVEDKLYENYLDVDSAIMFMLLNELVANGDFFQTSNDEVFGPHSTYLYKDRGENEIIHMGPVWDFDYKTFTPTTSWRGFTSKKYYYYYLCHNQDFVDRIKFLWTKYMTVFEGLTDYIDDMAGKISLSQEFDEAKWPNWNQTNRTDNGDWNLSYKQAITRMKESFNARIEWMNTKIDNLVVTNPSGYVDKKGKWHPDEWLYQ